MSRTVSLRELDKHLSRANRLVEMAFASDAEEPPLDFRELSEHLRAALGLLENGDARDCMDEIFFFRGHA